MGEQAHPSPANRAALERAYRGTRFEVDVDGDPAAIRIDRPPPAPVAERLARHAPPTGAFLTAWNPRSRPLDEAENRRRQAALLDTLAAAGLDHLPGRGVDPAGEWPAEESVLVLGVEREAACSFAEAYEQNALVWLDGDAPASLVYTRVWNPLC